MPNPVGNASLDDFTHVDDDWDVEFHDFQASCTSSSTSTRSRVHVDSTHPATMPLCDQATVEAEADSWAARWNEFHAYSSEVIVSGTPPLSTLMPDMLVRAASTFPAGTGVGTDNVSPRALCRLSKEAIRCLCMVLSAAELLGYWPECLHLVLIVLLPKPDGGRRPIGLFPTIIRVWMRARVYIAREWEAANQRPCLYGGPSMGAQRAAWQASYAAESAARSGKYFAQSLLDLARPLK